jgi:hypothetical protein
MDGTSSRNAHESFHTCRSGSTPVASSLHACEKTAFLSHLYYKTTILPRQARDEHKENSKTMPFSQVVLVAAAWEYPPRFIASSKKGFSTVRIGMKLRFLPKFGRLSHSNFTDLINLSRQARDKHEEG